MKMEPIVSSETSAIKSQTPGNYPKRNKLHLQHGESLKRRNNVYICTECTSLVVSFHKIGLIIHNTYIMY